MKKKTVKKDQKHGSDHECFWREASMKLAKCVVLTLQTGGKLGVGSGMMMKEKDGKRIVERWDTDFIEALAFIGVEVVDKPKEQKRRSKAIAA
jgi:hypothetical protein